MSMIGGSDAMKALVYQMSQNNADSSMLINAQQQANNTQLRVEEMQLGMAAESEKSEWNKWKIIQDLENKKFEIINTVNQDTAKTTDKMFQKWDDVVKG